MYMENFNIKKRDYPITQNPVSWGLVSACIFYYDHRPKSNGLYPIKIRLTYQGERTYYNTGHSMSPEDWKKFNTGRGDIKDTRDLIQAQMKGMEAEVNRLFKAGEFSFDKLAKRLRKSYDDVFEAFGERISKLRESGRIGNAVVYECALSSIKAHTGTKKLPFNKVTASWLQKYDDSMETAGKSTTTRSMYLRALRTIILASDSPSPFGKGKFMVKAGKGRKIALTKPQMNYLMELPVKPGSSTEKMRDLFFSVISEMV